ncbi:MAG: hypothetical protein HRU22_03810, partial [Gammaproteobacteria bacterium]|nr:hypothetical protein [Gammaproteobacteria bacterium]
MKKTPIALAISTLILLAGCNDSQQDTAHQDAAHQDTAHQHSVQEAPAVELLPAFKDRLGIYKEVTLTT